MAVACTGKKTVPVVENPLFEQADSSKTGITFNNKLQETKDFNILSYLYYYNGAGVAIGDVNQDGLTDLFFVSNQGKNKLYLNKGNFKFQDISESAGIGGFADWKTGVTMADVNGDGWLDIYVCAVGNYKGLEGSNELYINNGVGPDGQVSFTEKAADYGLDFSGFATQAAFFDYDRDGDLDVYLLNHAVHTARSYDRVTARNLRDNEAGDYLLQNQLITNKGAAPKGAPVKFKDVSQEAGIYGAAMGYGLGIAVSDFNHDGWDDIYVSNDFHEDDYYYLNNGNGTFTESVKEHFRHLSRFSMGNDAADINNDGYPDLMTLDMYPEDEKIEKESMGEDPIDIYLYKLQFGYFNQYSRNCLQLNLDGQKFSDIGLMAGVAATDWSWSTLLADYDNDGRKDIFITNGIVRRPNNLDYIKFASADSM
ncbi:MAG: VCBS repeat-containing protein, partial [Bacteroidota bacterium]|nr:VCBS repeat-containing protein [Bacteroidota bacterium]